MIEIDGSQGEGGGQVLRTALALSLVTGTPFRIRAIRANRRKPGLMRQHLACVAAARAVGAAHVAGAELGASEIEFHPGSVRPGRYALSIGSAGSTGLVLQTILPALLCAGDLSEVTVEGGTHNPLAPTFDFLERSFVPVLARMGADVTLQLERAGFAPAGGGSVVARVTPCARLVPLELVERGAVRNRLAVAHVALLARSIGERELRIVERRLGWSAAHHEVREHPTSRGPGNALTLLVECENVTATFTAVGERGLSAERVATAAVDDARAWIADGVAVEPHLADQLLIPLALAGGGAFSTSRPTEHTRTNAQVVEMFLPVAIRVRADEGARHVVEVVGR